MLLITILYGNYFHEYTHELMFCSDTLSIHIVNRRTFDQFAWKYIVLCPHIKLSSCEAKISRLLITVEASVATMRPL